LKRKRGEDEEEVEDEDEDEEGSGEWNDLEEDEDDSDSDSDEGDWVDVGGDEGDKKEVKKPSDEDEDEDEDVNLDDFESASDDSSDDSGDDSDDWIDVNHDEDKKPLTKEEAEKIRAETSSNRVFSSQDFERMKKLAAREAAEKRDPRAMAKRRKLIKEGKTFDDMSDDEGEEDNKGVLRVKGMINPENIMAESVRRKNDRMDRLQSIMEGRTAFEAKKRDGGSTNTEKLRNKNFAMQQHSYKNRTKGRNDKQTKKNGAGKRRQKTQNGKRGSAQGTKRRRK